MELELSRVDYTIVGITNNHCLKLLPASLPKEQQKVVIADNDGIVQMFSVKKDTDLNLHFKTLPGKSVASVQIAGAVGKVNDKIFVAYDNEVRGYTKKGKLFLTFDPGMIEPINTMFVLGSDLFLCGQHIYNHFKDCKGVGSYLCGDRIVDVIAFYAQKSRRLITLIACEGRMIRSLEHARVTNSMEVEASPTVLHVYESDEAKSVLFGTVDGRVGILELEKGQGFERWLISNEKNSMSAVSCIDSYDLNGSEVKNLIIGRQDGSIEVYNVNVLDDIDAPLLVFTTNFNECITALQCGIVGCEGFDEILVATYTGRIFGLTTQQIHESSFNKLGGVSSVNSLQKIHKLKMDLEELQGKLLKEREKYQSLTQSFFDELSAIPVLAIKDSFVLSKETSTYTLSIEVPTTIDNVLLQSNIPMELLDVEKNSAVVSYSDSQNSDGNYLLASYRCQVNTSRLELRLRTSEGQKGSLQVYVTPIVQPKCTRLLQYEIKCLSLHYKLHQFDEIRPMNNLTIKGSFSLAEIHTWLSQCLPEVSDKPQNSQLWFKSSLLDTVLLCSYQKGVMSCQTDNISTMFVLKDFLTVEATKRKITTDITLSINDDSIDFVLKLIWSKVDEYKRVVKESKLLGALDSLGVSEEEIAKYLSSKYKAVLGKRMVEKTEQPKLERYCGILRKLYTDYYNLKGRNVNKSALVKIEDLLNGESLEDLLTLFRPELLNT